jgi:putative peptidoglycan lipid II flippase
MQGTWTVRFGALAVLVGGGALVYAAATFLLGAFTRDDIRLLRRKPAA